MDPIAKIARFVANTAYADIDEAALAQAKVFILDSFGVGLMGSGEVWSEQILRLLKTWGDGDDARVWSGGDRLPAPAAAMCNAYQIHNCEFDCVHEAAVVHPATVVLPAALAAAERDGGISGRALLTAVVLGIDIACALGVAATSGLRFFRPGTAGAFGGVTAIGKLLGFDTATLINGYSIAYGQLCGTMQAHSEGSELLAVQIGFNARNAVIAADMAQAGLSGPKQVLEGEYGYFRLIESEASLAPVLADLGKIWRVTEVAHKPYPAGRATHGLIDGLLRLQAAHGFAADDIDAVIVDFPPLTAQLVERPPKDDMDTNYARLCAAFAGARALINGAPGIADFTGDILRDRASLALARRFEIRRTDNPDPNALTPIEIAVRLADGRRFEQHLDVVYGNPANAMTREAHLEKFRRNARAGRQPLGEPAIERLIATVDRLEELTDVGALVDDLSGRQAPA